MRHAKSLLQWDETKKQNNILFQMGPTSLPLTLTLSLARTHTHTHTHIHACSVVKKDRSSLRDATSKIAWLLAAQLISQFLDRSLCFSKSWRQKTDGGAARLALFSAVQGRSGDCLDCESYKNEQWIGSTTACTQLPHVRTYLHEISFLDHKSYTTSKKCNNHIQNHHAHEWTTTICFRQINLKGYT